jgi:hypothetical protein
VIKKVKHISGLHTQNHAKSRPSAYSTHLQNGMKEHASQQRAAPQSLGLHTLHVT